MPLAAGCDPPPACRAITDTEMGPAQQGRFICAHQGCAAVSAHMPRCLRYHGGRLQAVRTAPHTQARGHKGPPCPAPGCGCTEGAGSRHDPGSRWVPMVDCRLRHGRLRPASRVHRYSPYDRMRACTAGLLMGPQPAARGRELRLRGPKPPAPHRCPARTACLPAGQKRGACHRQPIRLSVPPGGAQQVPADPGVRHIRPAAAGHALHLPACVPAPPLWSRAHHGPGMVRGCGRQAPETLP